MRTSNRLFPFLVFSLSFTFGLGSSGLAETSKIFSFERLTLIKDPTTSPPGIPSYIIPQGAKYRLSLDYRPRLNESAEAFLSWEHSESPVNLEKEIIRKVERTEWKLLQSDRTPDRILLICESYSLRVLTYIIEPSGEGSNVRMYLKKKSAF